MAAERKQVMHIEPTKSFELAEANENERRWDEKKFEQKNRDPDNHYDMTRLKLNFEIGPDGKVHPLGYQEKTLDERLNDRLSELGFHRFKPGSKNQPNCAAKIIFQGNHDRMMEIAFGGQVVNLEKGADNSHIVRNPLVEQWAMDVHEWLCRRFRKENVIGFEVHLDETSAHIHALVVPVGQRGKSGKEAVRWAAKFGENGSEWSRVLTEMHTSLYEEVNKKYGLERGDSVKGRNVKHLSKKEYIVQLEREAAMKEKTLKGLNTMIENARVVIAEKQAFIAQLNKDVEEGKLSLEEANRKAEAAQKVIDQKQALIDDKTDKINVANAQFNAVLGNINKVRSIMTPYRNPNPDVTPPQISGKPGLFQSFENWREEQNAIIAKSFWKEVKHVKDVVVADAEKQIKAVKQNILVDYAELRDLRFNQEEQQERVNELESALSVLANQLTVPGLFRLVIETTNALLGGEPVMIPSGGGGSDSDLPWNGRRKDEDDEKFLLRCLLHASKLVHRSQSAKRRGLHR